MATDAVQISITADALIEAVGKLNLADKQRLLDVLEQQVAEAEEAAGSRCARGDAGVTR